MAFVEIEDIHKICEVIIFPRTYNVSKELLVEGNLIVVRGKVDARNSNKPKILADTVSQELTSYHAAEEEDDVAPEPQPKRDGNGRRAQHPETKLAEMPGNYLLAEPPAPPPLLPLKNTHPAQITGDNGVQLHITIPRSGNITQDKHCLKTVYNLLIQQQGRDHFSFYIPKGNKKIRVDFPNHTTKDSALLRQQLTQLLGGGSLRVE